ncbi:MAG: PilZ domain-containing protein [Thalassotalea sp.]
MTKDFSKYQHIIEDFKGQVPLNDFERRFADATKALTKTERFLLKMEIKRLATPCTRLVDLRGHVNGICRPYEEEGRVHFIDDVAIQLFEENITLYGGYTFGVYEALMNTENNFRVMYQKEKANATQEPNPVVERAAAKVFEKTQYPAKLYPYGPYYDRKEERMNFAISINVSTDSNKSFEAMSSDISVNGCKFRLSKAQDLKLNQVVNISFLGLEAEFDFKYEESYSYEIKNIHQVENHQFIGVERVNNESNTSKDHFKKFLIDYILRNKRRYKVNLDNTITALHSRIFEHFTVPKSNELPIFLQKTNGVVLPRYTLTCHNNQNVYQYWQDEKYRSTLHSLVTPERVERLKTAQKKGKALYVYSFIHRSQGKSFFYTADNVQLNEDKQFMAQYLGFAANKSDFMVTQLTGLEVHPEYSHSPLTLSNMITEKDAHLNSPPPEDVQQSIENLCYIVVANEISDELLLKQYTQLPSKNINIAKLKSFGHKRLTKPLIVDDVGINFNNQRSETRFCYTTPVVAGRGNKSWQGKSEDFSASGLKLTLDKPSALNHGDVVGVSFPHLQKITSSFDLKELPYEVVRVNKKKNILNLRVHIEKRQHIGRSFFKALIDKNKEKLTRDEYASMSPDLAKGLRNVYSRSLVIPSFVIQTSGSRYKIEVVAGNVENENIVNFCRQLSDRKRLYNLYPILNNLQATTLMQSTLKKMQAGDVPIVDVLYIAIDATNDVIEQGVTTKLESELNTQTAKKQFIRNALKSGSFLCVQVKLSRTDSPDIDYLNPELSYITTYAIHRSKQLEQEIWSVAGVMQLLDITEEAMIRYQIIPEEDQSNIDNTANEKLSNSEV